MHGLGVDFWDFMDSFPIFCRLNPWNPSNPFESMLYSWTRFCSRLVFRKFSSRPTRFLVILR